MVNQGNVLSWDDLAGLGKPGHHQPSGMSIRQTRRLVRTADGLPTYNKPATAGFFISELPRNGSNGTPGRNIGYSTETARIKEVDGLRRIVALLTGKTAGDRSLDSRKTGKWLRHPATGRRLARVTGA